jgi:hypothetical protein
MERCARRKYTTKLARIFVFSPRVHFRDDDEFCVNGGPSLSLSSRSCVCVCVFVRVCVVFQISLSLSLFLARARPLFIYSLNFESFNPNVEDTCFPIPWTLIILVFVRFQVVVVVEDDYLLLLLLFLALRVIVFHFSVDPASALVRVAKGGENAVNGEHLRVKVLVIMVAGIRSAVELTPPRLDDPN